MEKKLGGLETTGVAITGSTQTIVDGISVTFASTAGHVVGDKWFIIGMPGATKPFQYWADTTTGILKQRSANNNYWIDIRTLVDTTPPIITMLGSSPVDIDEGTPYADAGATALDNLEGDLTANIVTNGLPIDVNTPGSYSVTYDVSDSENNAATPVTRAVNVNALPLHDGSTWTQATASAAWSGRNSFGSLVYNNKMWVMGGETPTLQNDVWSSTDGITWTQETASAAWPTRSSFAVISYDNKMWVMGGGDTIRNDVWSSTDGITWTQVTAAAGWSVRLQHTSLVYDNKMWVLGGYGATHYNNVYSSVDGINWTQATASAAWFKRRLHTSVVFDNKMWVLGGYNGSNLNDVWHTSD